MDYFESLEKNNSEKGKNVETGFQDLEKLSFFGKEVSIEILQKCLSNPNQIIRILAIEKVSNHCRQDFTWLFAIALNDKCDYVVTEAAQALANINTDEALEVLSNAFFEDAIERPHQIANAISQFGERSFDVFLKATKSSSPNIRYYSAKDLGSTGLESAKNILEEMANNDNEKTTFTALVSSGARKGLKTLLKNLEKKT